MAESPRVPSGDALTPGPGGSAHPGGITPARRLLFWLKASFVGDAVLAAIGGLLVAEGEDIGVALLVFTAVRAALGVVALLLAARALERRDPADDSPSVVR